MRITARRYDSGDLVELCIAGDAITSVTALHDTSDRQLPFVAPGFIDLQVNGYGGQEFTRCDLNADTVERISMAMSSLGVTRYLPTVITHRHQVLVHALQTIAGTIEQREAVAQRVAGIHLEGPYISAEDGPRGAHPLEHVRPPDWDEFQQLQEAAGGRIKLITLSPEYDSAVEFTRRASQQGVIVSIGHTSANAAQIQAVVAAGARMSTHLGNGAHALVHRHTNYIWEQLSNDLLSASLIVDGFHLPPGVVKAMVRAKTPQRVVLVSDMTGVAGAIADRPGRYELADLGAVEVLDDGRVVMAGQSEYLAGATQPLSVGIANVMRFAGVSLAEAIDMASKLPAQLLRLPCGLLTAGAPADLVLFQLTSDNRIDVQSTYLAGRCVWQA